MNPCKGITTEQDAPRVVSVNVLYHVVGQALQEGTNRRTKKNTKGRINEVNGRTKERRGGGGEREPGRGTWMD